MNNQHHNYSRGIGVFGLMALVVAFTAATAAAQWPEGGIDPNSFIDPDWPLDPLAWMDAAARQRYAEEGAEIVPWTKSAAVPSADNAALLYYQAFLLHPETDSDTTMLIHAVLRGAEPDATIRTYLGHSRDAIHVAEMASQIPNCTWGLQPVDARPTPLTTTSPLRRLAFLLAVDARTLATDGHYRAAFARCLVQRRLARHIGAETIIMRSVSAGVDAVAANALQDILGQLPPDGKTLIWLRGQLAKLPSAPPSLVQTLENEFELLLDFYRTNTAFLDTTRQHWAERHPGDDAAVNLTDDEMIAHAREASTGLLNELGRIIDSDISYAQKCEQIDSLMAGFQTDPDNNRPLGWSLVVQRDWQIRRLFALHVRIQCHLSVVRTAIELYLAKAEMGQLPETLPDHAPNDPSSDQPFIYEITPEGFRLHCQARYAGEDEGWAFEFQVND